jgi:acyl transferase domain-containing protein/acyl carrier protein
MGEIAAAYVSGVLSLEDAVRVVCYRSQLLKQLRGQGSMLVTELSPEQAEELLKRFDDDVSVAVINSPLSTVLSGDTGTIKKIINLLESQNLFCKLVNVDVASHSSQMDCLSIDMQKGLSTLNPHSAKIPFYSTVTGTLADKMTFNAEYWMENLRKPVLFSNAVSQLLKNDFTCFVEISPHPILLGSIQQSLQSHHKDVSLLPSLRREEPEREIMFRTLGHLYTAGFTINWKKLSYEKGKYVELPLVPWQRSRYWLDEKSDGTKNYSHQAFHVHPLLGERMSLANTPTSYVWQTTFDNVLMNFFSNHQIGEEILFPAAGYIEMALQCAAETGLSKDHTVCDFAFKESMVLHREKPCMIQTQLLPGGNDKFTFSVYSKTSEDKNWILNASATFAKNETVEDICTTDRLPHDVIPKQSTAQFLPGNFYYTLQQRGIKYGAAFRCVQQIWTKDNVSLGYISLPESLQYETNVYQVHPALLDGCLQVLAAAQNHLFEHSFYLPTGCQQIRFYSRPGQHIWSHTSIKPETGNGEDALNADIRLTNDNGQLVAELVGFRLQRTSRRVRTLFSQQDTWLYQLEWQYKQASCALSTIAFEDRHWLILADNEGAGEGLAKRIEAGGGYCHLLHCKEFTSRSENINDDCFKELLEKRLNEISNPLHGVVHLWSLSTPTPASGIPVSSDAMDIYGCKSTLYLVQALARRMEALPHLWLITRGTQPIQAKDKIAAEQSPLWGLGKVISFELPGLKCSRIDLDPIQSVDEYVSLLVKEISIDDQEDQVAYREGRRYVPRLLPFTLKKSLVSPPLSFKSDGTYLITGGLGGLGLKTAEWMSLHGARHLVLIGRSKPSSPAADIIKRMKEKGVKVVVAGCDVSDKARLLKLFDSIKNNMPPLRGIIHAAGVLDDGSLLDLTNERMKKVMMPKLDGTLNLHLASLNLPLDFFVLYSSAVSVLGSPGQGNYAAASAYLDAFAYYRKSMGLPAISINWGPWAEVGLAAKATERLKKQNASTEHLIKVIKIERGLEILEELLKESTPQIMVLPFDLKNLIELYPAAAGLPFLEQVGGNETHVARLYARPKLRQQYVAPRNEIERKIAQLWQQTLHIDLVGVHDSFFELGGDSVLAAQVLSIAQKTFGIRINPQDAFKAFTIEKLAQMLEEQILNRIEAMSEDEAQRLLYKEN